MCPEGGLTYFIITRKIFDSPIWREDIHVLKLFLYLIGEARHSTKPKRYPNCDIHRGELLTSLSSIAEDNEYRNRKIITKWSRAKVARMLEYLSEHGYIELLPDTYGTHIKICNYSIYQDPNTYKADASETTPDASETQVRTNKKGNNGKNEKKTTKAGVRFTPPSIEEISKYCSERNNGINPKIFIDHYTSNGWMVGKNKMRDWKAAVRTWESRQQQNGQNIGRHKPQSEILESELGAY